MYNFAPSPRPVVTKKKGNMRSHLLETRSEWADPLDSRPSNPKEEIAFFSSEKPAITVTITKGIHDVFGVVISN